MTFTTVFTEDGDVVPVPHVIVDEKYGKMLVLPLPNGKEFRFGPKKAHCLVKYFDEVRKFALQTAR